jgi:hypothetical protein
VPTVTRGNPPKADGSGQDKLTDLNWAAWADLDEFKNVHFMPRLVEDLLNLTWYEKRRALKNRRKKRRREIKKRLREAELLPVQRDNLEFLLNAMDDLEVVGWQGLRLLVLGFLALALVLLMLTLILLVWGVHEAGVNADLALTILGGVLSGGVGAMAWRLRKRRSSKR